MFCAVDVCGTLVSNADDSKGFVCTSCGSVVSRGDGTEENLNAESQVLSTKEIDDSSMAPSVADDCSVAGNCDTMLGNTDDGFASSTWTEDMQVKAKVCRALN